MKPPANLPQPPPPQADTRAGADPRRDLVQRVAGSTSFQKAKRLREFLQFVGERALSEPERAIREHEIGSAVFGRQAEFDPSADTLVRVHASQLRKKLQHYFATEGAGEPLVIELPRGSYLPVFHERAATRIESPEPQPPSRRRLRAHGLALGLGTLCIILAGLSLALWLRDRDLSRGQRTRVEPRPAVERLWKQLFGNGKTTYVVLSDSMLTVFQDLLHTQLSPTEYQRKQFLMMAEQRLADPLTRDFAHRAINRQYTSIADVNVERRISALGFSLGTPIEVLLAREAGPAHLRTNNTILVGPRRANPWIELFEKQLNFRSRYDEERRMSYLDNAAPRPGEQTTYTVTWDQAGYCRVAYLPNLDGNGTILIISGTDMSSSDAGAEFITSEHWVKRLHSTLGVPDNRPLPHFEALLRTRLVFGAAPNFELVAHRVQKP